jgi:hypothetical protein
MIRVIGRVCCQTGRPNQLKAAKGWCSTVGCHCRKCRLGLASFTWAALVPTPPHLTDAQDDAQGPFDRALIPVPRQQRLARRGRLGALDVWLTCPDLHRRDTPRGLLTRCCRGKATNWQWCLNCLPALRAALRHSRMATAAAAVPGVHWPCRQGQEAAAVAAEHRTLSPSH